MYLKKTWIYKDHIEIKKYHTPRYGVKGEKRIRKQKPTEEAIQKANEKNSKDKLRRILINNFSEGDWFLTLTYGSDCIPDVKESKTILGKFIRQLGREYKKSGYELKWIKVTEWNAKRIHHHMVLNNIPGLQIIINRLWPYGGRHYTALYPDYDYEALAEYLTKETSKTFRDDNNPYRQRYSCSRNLKKPEEKIEVIKANEWKDEPSLSNSLKEKGYYLDKDSLYEGVDPFGFPYQQYMLIRSAERRPEEINNNRRRMRSEEAEIKT